VTVHRGGPVRGMATHGFATRVNFRSPRIGAGRMTHCGRQPRSDTPARLHLMLVNTAQIRIDEYRHLNSLRGIVSDREHLDEEAISRLDAGLIVIGLLILVPFVYLQPKKGESGSPASQIPVKGVHVDHRDIVKGEFKTGQDVTRACLACHKDAAAS